MTDFIMLIGLVGSGKSTVAKQLEKTYSAVIVESDEYRQRLYGDSLIQGDNNALFDLIHSDILSNLKNGKSVILDATNVNRKNRVSMLQKLNGLNVKKIAYLVATEYEKCLEQNNKRERKVPENVINRMWKSFDVPLYNEGWDAVEIVYNYDKSKYSIQDYLSMADLFDQDNYHHTMTLGNHSRKAADIISKNIVDDHVIQAALLHDNGKLYTKTFTTMKGDVSEIAHYFGHENCGSYESLFYMVNLLTRTQDILFVAGLIRYHMQMYFLNSEKAKQKLISIVGEDMFFFLELLHQADVQAH